MFLGCHEEGSDGSWLVPLNSSEACSVGDLPRLVTMLFKGIAEEGIKFVISLMLVLVVLLGTTSTSCGRKPRLETFSLGMK